MLTYLALGDSYTIGEQVSEMESFPFQTVDILKHTYQIDCDNPEIIAVTGWTTAELLHGIEARNRERDFDLVTLLIGVNNQYRGQNIDLYAKEFERLLKKAILFAKGITDHVFVLSIPDWGITPFAKEKDVSQIQAEIDEFNKTKRRICLEYHCKYIDITESTRENGRKPENLTPDLLHYSGKEYRIWAEMLSKEINEVFNK